MTPACTVAMFHEAGITNLYYIFPLRNILSIKHYGILSLNEVKRRGISYQSFALDEAQARRDAVEVQLDNGTAANIHELVPLYFNPCNPTLYRRRRSWNKRGEELGIAVIAVSSLFTTIATWTVADGNAASPLTRCTTGANALSGVRFDILRASSWTTTDELQRDHKRRRCAEVMVSPSVSTSCISEVVVYDSFAAPLVHPHFKVYEDRQLFYSGPFASRRR
jgi:hypothetical protein